MSLKIGIYDFFAYMIPGGITAAAFLFILTNHYGLFIDYANLPTTHILFFAIVSYLCGYIVDAISRKMWLDFFMPKQLFEKTLRDFNKQNSKFNISLKESDWYVVFTYIKNQNSEIADAIDKLSVQSKMLKNSSFGSLIFSIVFLANFLTSEYLIQNAALSVTCFVIAIILAKQAVKFRTWFYGSIYQSYLGVMDLLPVKVTTKSQKTIK